MGLSAGAHPTEEAMLKDLRLIPAYYLGSPIFFLVGLWWGFEVRVTFLPDPYLRFGYYVLLSGLGLLTHFRPSSRPWVALSESTVNLLLILAWILLPIYGLTEAALEGGVIGVPYSPLEVVINGGLAGTFFILGFYRAQGEVLSRIPWLGRPKREGPRGF
jgi:hypothetical protein